MKNPIETEHILNNMKIVFCHDDIQVLSDVSYDFISRLPKIHKTNNIKEFKQIYSHSLGKLAKEFIALSKLYYIQFYQRDKDFKDWFGEEYCGTKTETVLGLIDIAKKYRNSLINQKERYPIKKQEKRKRRTKKEISKINLNHSNMM